LTPERVVAHVRARLAPRQSIQALHFPLPQKPGTPLDGRVPPAGA
jgi:hypothetical protein